MPVGNRSAGRLKTQGARDTGAVLGVVRGMPLAIVHGQLGEVERRHARQAGRVDTDLVGVRPALVIGVDATDGAEMVLSDTGVEAVGRELVRALPNFE